MALIQWLAKGVVFCGVWTVAEGGALNVDAEALAKRRWRPGAVELWRPAGLKAADTSCGKCQPIRGRTGSIGLKLL